MSEPIRLRGMPKKLFLTGFLSLPVLAISALLYWIGAGMARPSPMADAPRVGFGAGATGGANAIGEMLRGDRTRAPLTTEPARAQPDAAPAAPSAAQAAPAAGSFLAIEVAGGAGSAADLTRELRVWLPPEYDAARSYPVLYLLDSQFAFSTPADRSWGADTVAARLIELGLIEPLVIVGVPHAGTGRAEEFVPVAAFPGVAPAGDAFAEWFLRVVPEAVAAEVAVTRDPQSTAIGGAGFGAVAATVIATRAPDRFGGLLLESMPTLAGAGQAWPQRLRSVERWPARVVIGMGGAEVGEPELDERYRAWAQELGAILADAGLDGTRLLVNIDESASHEPEAWRERLGDALQVLFSPRP